MYYLLVDFLDEVRGDHSLYILYIEKVCATEVGNLKLYAQNSHMRKKTHQKQP